MTHRDNLQLAETGIKRFEKGSSARHRGIDRCL